MKTGDLYLDSLTLLELLRHNVFKDILAFGELDDLQRKNSLKVLDLFCAAYNELTLQIGFEVMA